MTFSLKILRPARKQLDKLDDKLAHVIYEHIEKLKEDPYRPRSRMDIIKIEGDRYATSVSTENRPMEG